MAMIKKPGKPNPQNEPTDVRISFLNELQFKTDDKMGELLREIVHTVRHQGEVMQEINKNLLHNNQKLNTILSDLDAIEDQLKKSDDTPQSVVDAIAKVKQQVQDIDDEVPDTGV